MPFSLGGITHTLGKINILIHTEGGWSGEQENEQLGNNKCFLMKTHTSNSKRMIKITNIL